MLIGNREFKSLMDNNMHATACRHGCLWTGHLAEGGQDEMLTGASHC
jgi:hypothetical protein